MRVSVHDPDFIWGTRVFVDGVDVTNHVHTADDRKGKAWGYAFDENGHHYVIGDTAAPKVWTGKVEIVLPCSRLTWLYRQIKQLAFPYREAPAPPSQSLSASCATRARSAGSLVGIRS